MSFRMPAVNRNGARSKCTGAPSPVDAGEFYCR